MAEINFCPFCSAPEHKLIVINDKYNICKECNRFFLLNQILLKCPKCDKTEIINSDFPSPQGELILQCRSCKKMAAAKEFLKYNKIK